jgi:hypothetical protein
MKADKWIKLGSVNVDTATLIVCDPVYADEAAQWSTSEAFYDKMGKSKKGVAALTRPGFGAPIALALSTGYGDGFYDVLGRFEEGRLAELNIKFIPHPQFGRPA